MSLFFSQLIVLSGLAPLLPFRLKIGLKRTELQARMRCPASELIKQWDPEVQESSGRFTYT